MSEAPHPAPATASEASAEELLEDQLFRAIRAGYRILVVEGDDEQAMREIVEAVAERLEYEARTYSRSAGIDASGSKPSASFLREGLWNAQPECVWIAADLLCEADLFLRRALREHALEGHGAVVVCLESALDPRMVAPEFWLGRLAAPTVETLGDKIEAWASAQLRSHDSPCARHALANTPRLAAAALGLHWRAVRLALCASVGDPDSSPERLRDEILALKARSLAAQGMVDAVSDTPAQLLGGLGNFKQWLRRRARAFEPDARQAAIPLPRGVLLIGVQGCGKSLAARVCAHELKLPLYRLDPGRIFEGVVGASESRLDALLGLLDRMAPLVLWLDEIDKTLSGGESSASDGGTTSRVVGRLLTWLQEHEHPVFVVATANAPHRLPPEMLRRGRFDELFFVDLPSADARAQIVDIHLLQAPLRSLGSAPPIADPLTDFVDLARAADGFSGAELESAVVEARLNAYANGRDVSAGDFQDALRVSVPLSVSRQEEISALREWAKTRARPA